jgi:3,4-dihydroxy 2-butanone 4-phosphate synthase / GTP cyclohydrolase II
MNMFNSIDEALEDIRKGKMVVVVDDENRENEGDLIMAAQYVTPDAINFMASKGRGLICTPITTQKAFEMKLTPMVKANDSLHYTAFTESIDYIGAGTGISTQARSLTIKALNHASTLPDELVRPGHIFPLIAREGGVIERAGHTEAAVDLSRLAGLNPVGVICEILNEDGTMARVPDLLRFCRKFELKLISIEDLITYRLEKEQPLSQLLQ